LALPITSDTILSASTGDASPTTANTANTRKRTITPCTSSVASFNQACYNNAESADDGPANIYSKHNYDTHFYSWLS